MGEDIDNVICTINGTEYKDGDKCNNNDWKLDEINCEEQEKNYQATCQFYKYGPTTEATYMQIYNLFGFFWGLFFLEALDQMVLGESYERFVRKRALVK